jgi:hypothetical protein
MSSVNENEVKSIFRHADLKEFITSSSELQKKKKKKIKEEVLQAEGKCQIELCIYGKEQRLESIEYVDRYYFPYFLKH